MQRIFFARIEFSCRILFFALLAAGISLGCGQADTEPVFSYRIADPSEIAAQYARNPEQIFSEFALAAAHPLAADAGYQILRAGGSAVDAAVAVQMVLALVEPQSSGIGGGTFLMTWDGEQVFAYDGRETVPSLAGESLFLDEMGEPLDFSDAVHSGLSVGVPGTIAVLWQAHQNHGNLPWRSLFEPAIRLAEEGFHVSQRLHEQLREDAGLRHDEIGGRFFYDEQSRAHPAGYLLRNHALAAILRDVAANGPRAFYEGAVAGDIVRRIRSHHRPGWMRQEDLAAYSKQALSRRPLCSAWKEWHICGFPPPSSGHLTMMQILGIMQYLDLPTPALQDSVPAIEWLHGFFEASGLAYADRNRYIADPDFVDPPGGDWRYMLEPSYLEQRASLIGPVSMGRAEPGDPGPGRSPYGIQKGSAGQGTSHISIVDRNGHAVAMTTTIEQRFGSRIMSDGGTGLPGGFLLNNQLTDFSFVPVDPNGRPIANRVEPGKRPRSSMSPTLVFNRDGKSLVAVLGSPGGAAIIPYTAKTLAGLLEFRLTPWQAIHLPNFANLNGPSMLEAGRFSETFTRNLEEKGHKIIRRPLESGIHVIMLTEEGFSGGADPRREGVVLGR